MSKQINTVRRLIKIVKGANWIKMDFYEYGFCFCQYRFQKIPWIKKVKRKKWPLHQKKMKPIAKYESTDYLPF